MQEVTLEDTKQKETNIRELSDDSLLSVVKTRPTLESLCWGHTS